MTYQRPQTVSCGTVRSNTEKYHSGLLFFRVLDTPDKWFGVTYKEDKQAVVDAIKGLIDAGVYKEKLFDRSNSG